MHRLFNHVTVWISTIVLLAWWLFATAGTPADSRPLPSVCEVLAAGMDLNAEGLLFPSIAISLTRVVLGLTLGIAIGVPSGIIAGASRLGCTIIDKPVHMLRAIPFPALAPLLIVWLGIGEGMKITLIAIGSFSLIYVNVRDGVRSVDTKLLELARSYHVGKRTTFFKILFLGTLPNFMTGLRFALTVSWIALVTCETVNSSTGIGYILSRSQQFYRTDQMVLCVMLYAILGLAGEALVALIERAATPWRHTA